MSDGLSAISIETEIVYVRKIISVPNFYVFDNHTTHQLVHILKKQKKKTYLHSQFWSDKICMH